MKRSKAPSMLIQKRQAVASGGRGIARPMPVPSKKTASPSLESVPAASTSQSAVKASPVVRKKSIGLKRKPFKSPLRTSNGPAVGTASAKKRPLAAAPKPVMKGTPSTEDSKQGIGCYEVFWTKRSNKKHKNYSDVRGRTCQLKDLEGKDLAKTTNYSNATLMQLKDGQSLDIGMKEVEIVKRRDVDDYTSGRIFAGSLAAPVVPVKKTLVKRKKAAAFKPHHSAGENGSTPSAPTAPKAAFSPDQPGNIVLFRGEGEVDDQGRPLCSVVIDPHLGRRLRPHQVEGVQFLYNCIAGGKNGTWKGCVLADSMGLGKTLQALTVLYTVLKQGPRGIPLARKAIVICPSSLVENWRKEFVRWLGVRLKPLVVGGTSSASAIKQTIAAFSQSHTNRVLIISYGYFRRQVKALQAVKCDLIMCDEGHKLKNATSKITLAVKSMPAKQRIILSGTPIQNDLQEFFVVMDVVNPGVLGSLQSFKRVFEQPINKCHDRSSSEVAREEGMMRAQELANRCNMFILRRPSSTLIPYLPPRVEQVVFCRLAPLQERLYRHFLSSRRFMKDLMGGKQAYAFQCIQMLQQLCNHPALIHQKCVAAANDEEDFLHGADRLFPKDFDPSACQVEFSGKIQLLDQMLTTIRNAEKKTKVVVVSNFTKTLDVIEQMLVVKKHKFLRLDGSTDRAKRMVNVDRFNNPHAPEFVFLLSSKAGGVGLNLIGASRLILFDPDWNPACDEQAMARIWREGQPDAVWIYRFMSTGTLEEKIYQRQLRKQGLSRSIVDAYVHGRSQFSADELKSVFVLNSQTLCETHDLIGCECCGGGKLMGKVANKKRLKKFGGSGGNEGEDDSLMMLNDSANFRHYDTAKNCSDPLLKELVTESESLNDTVTFIFESKTRSVEEYQAGRNQSSAPSGEGTEEETSAAEEEKELFDDDEEEQEAQPRKRTSSVIVSDDDDEEEDDFQPSTSKRGTASASAALSDSELDMSILQSDCESDVVPSPLPIDEAKGEASGAALSDSEPDLSFMQSDGEEDVLMQDVPAAATSDSELDVSVLDSDKDEDFVMSDG